MTEVVSNPGTKYRVLIGFVQDYTELHLDIPGLAELNTATLGLDPATYTYTDVTDDVINIDIVRGRARSVDNTTAGSCALRLLDQARDYDPQNTAGPYYGNISKGRPVVVQFRKTGPTWHELFTGTIEQIAYSMQPGGFQVAEFVATDSLAQLARQALEVDTVFAAALTGTRVNDILALATVTGTTDIDAGTVTAVTRTESAGASLVDLLQRVAAAEGGEFYTSATGALTFQQRYTNADPVTTYTLTPNLDSVQYSTITLETAAEVYPQVNVLDAAGAVQTARDLACYLDFTGVLNVDAGELLAEADALALAEYLLAIYCQETTNVRTIEVPVVQAIAAHQHDLLLTDLGDAVEVERTFDVGAPLSIVEYYAVEGIAHTINRQRHVMTFTLGAKTSSGWFMLNSVAFGVLDSNILA
jgi:hypothetical protein